MAKIYNVVPNVNIPVLNFRDVPKYKLDIEDYTQAVIKFCKDRYAKAGQSDKLNDECVGEVISFPVADGTADYVVACVKPVELVHLQTWDCYAFQYAKNLKTKDIVEKVRQHKALEKLFASKK